MYTPPREFLVFHFSGDPMTGTEAKAVVGLYLQYPDNWELAAYVRCTNEEKAFELTNNIDHDWRENPEVTPQGDKPLRSTSVGDVIREIGLDQPPKYYVVMNAGMQLVPGNFTV